MKLTKSQVDKVIIYTWKSFVLVVILAAIGWGILSVEDIELLIEMLTP